MSGMNITPGPWLYEPEGDSDGETVGIDHFVTARGGAVELCCPPSEADARLIAASPDLLTALQALARSPRVRDGVSGQLMLLVTSAELAAADTAIAKATGAAAADADGEHD